MRNPFESTRKLPRLSYAAGVARGILDKALECFPALSKAAVSLLQGSTADPLPAELIEITRRCFRVAFSHPEPEKSPGTVGGSSLDPSIFEAWGRVSGDPDGKILGSWLRHGAPLGIEQPIDCCGTFPVVEGPGYQANLLCNLERSFCGWENYASAEEEPAEVGKLLDQAREKHFCKFFDTAAELAEYLGANPVLNKLGLVTKVKVDSAGVSKVKYRLIWDLRESSVNTVVNMGERIILPRISDFVDDLLRLLAFLETGETISLVAVDFQDAFHNVPAGSDKRFTCSAFGNKLICFEVLVFGAKSSPTVWGRYAAFYGRSSAAILGNFKKAGLQVYVDDPALALVGSWEGRVRLLSRALLWAAVLGFPIAWDKAYAGNSIVWGGAQISLGTGDEQGTVIVTIPEEKLQTLQDEVKKVGSLSVVSRKRIRSLAGSLSFLAGLISYLRAFLSPLWAVCSANETSDGKRLFLRARSRQLRSLIHVTRIRKGLQWIEAFLSGEICKKGLRRVYRPVSLDNTSYLAVDASPWGMGGILVLNGSLHRYFKSDITSHDLSKFRATVGESAWNTVWEALALLIAFRLWLPLFPTNVVVRCKSDSRAALGAILKLSTASRSLQPIVREIALDMAQGVYNVQLFQHIPGFTNVLPDALSRLSAPGEAGKPFPSRLQSIQESETPVRDSSFWRVA